MKLNFLKSLFGERRSATPKRKSGLTRRGSFAVRTLQSLPAGLRFGYAGEKQLRQARKHPTAKLSSATGIGRR